MKKYKIGNRIITCDSPVKAAKIVKRLDSVKDSAINVKKVHNASEKYIVLEEDRPDGKEFYWVVGKNKYHGEKQYMGGGTLEFHLDEAIRLAKDYTIMEQLNEKYGEKEGYKRWMRGETDSVKDSYDLKRKLTGRETSPYDVRQSLLGLTEQEIKQININDLIEYFKRPQFSTGVRNDARTHAETIIWGLKQDLKQSKKANSEFDEDFLDIIKQLKRDGYNVHNERDVKEGLGADVGLNRQDQLSFLKSWREWDRKHPHDGAMKDEEMIRTPRGTFKLSNKPYRQLKEEGWGFWFDYADLYYDGKGPWYKIMHDPRTQSAVAAIYKSISDSVKDQMSVIVTNREDAEQELRDRNVQYDTIKLAAGTDDLHYFNGDKKVAVYSKVREKLYLMDSIKDSKVKDEDNFGYAIRNGKVYILLNGKVHQTFPNEDAAKDAGWNLDSMTQYD